MRASTPLRLTWHGSAPQEIFAEGHYRGERATGRITFMPTQLSQMQSHLMSRRQWEESRAEVEGHLKPLGSAIISPEVNAISLKRGDASGAWGLVSDVCYLNARHLDTSQPR